MSLAQRFTKFRAWFWKTFHTVDPTDTWTGPDKVAHFVLFGCFPAYVIGYQTQSIWFGFAIGAAFGLFKELMDDRIKHKVFGRKDLIVTWAGAAVGTGMAHLHWLLWNIPT